MKLQNKELFEAIFALDATELDTRVARYVMGETAIVIPAYSRYSSLADRVRMKVSSETFLEALACYIGRTLGASELRTINIADSQLLGYANPKNICQAALYAVSVGFSVGLYSGASTLDHGRELLTYSNQGYHVRPTADVAEGIAEQCLNLEFEELLEKADALGKRGHIERLMLDKISGLIGVNPRAEEKEEPEFLLLFDNDTNQVDLVALLDACVDQRVVADGTIHKYGFGNIFKAAYLEVHRSNLSKFPEKQEEAFAAVEHYEKQGTPCSAVWVQRYADRGNFVIRREADGKFLKPPTYSPANLAPIVEQGQ